MGILTGLLKDIFRGKHARSPIELSFTNKRLLNVGGGSKSITIPSHFFGWQHDLLDIDARGNPDIVCDARKLTKLDGGQYDAIYCSHNLEHYYRHEAIDVVHGFLHLLKGNGFAEIHVPDISQVVKVLVEKKLSLDDVLYQSPVGPVTAHDIIYGLQTEIKSSGKDYYAHKTGFTPDSLAQTLLNAGFIKICLRIDEYLAIHALAFKSEPTAEQYDLFKETWNMETRPMISSETIS